MLWTTRDQSWKWLLKFSRLLIVGDGDLSFARDIASMAVDEGSRLGVFASTFENKDDLFRKYSTAQEHAQALSSLGHTVMHGVDATNLEGTLPPSVFSDCSFQPFEVVVFNFPHIPGKSKNGLNRQLMHDFFQSVSSNKVLARQGIVRVCLMQGQGGTPLDQPRKWADHWQLISQACSHGLQLAGCAPFVLEGLNHYSPQGRRDKQRAFRLGGALMHDFVRGGCWPLPQPPYHVDRLIHRVVLNEGSDPFSFDWPCRNLTASNARLPILKSMESTAAIPSSSPFVRSITAAISNNFDQNASIICQEPDATSSLPLVLSDLHTLKPSNDLTSRAAWRFALGSCPFIDPSPVDRTQTLQANLAHSPDSSLLIEANYTDADKVHSVLTNPDAEEYIHHSTRFVDDNQRIQWLPCDHIVDLAHKLLADDSMTQGLRRHIHCWSPARWWRWSDPCGEFHCAVWRGNGSPLDAVKQAVANSFPGAEVVTEAAVQQLLLWSSGNNMRFHANCVVWVRRRGGCLPVGCIGTMASADGTRQLGQWLVVDTSALALACCRLPGWGTTYPTTPSQAAYLQSQHAIPDFERANHAREQITATEEGMLCPLFSRTWRHDVSFWLPRHCIPSPIAHDAAEIVIAMTDEAYAQYADTQRWCGWFVVRWAAACAAGTGQYIRTTNRWRPRFIRPEDVEGGIEAAKKRLKEQSVDGGRRIAKNYKVLFIDGFLVGDDHESLCCRVFHHRLGALSSYDTAVAEQGAIRSAVDSIDCFELR